MDNQASIEAIQQANLEICKSFETLDFRAASRYLADDCDYITFNGMYLKGREEYIRVHEELMNNFMFRGAKLEGQIKQVRFLNETTAIVISIGAIRFRWQKQAPQSRQSINTTVWVKNTAGEWQFTAFHNCRVKKIGRFAGWLLKLGKK
ncbi:uncharacterized protein (TIGR02246 family) [Chitinophaga niastensis]|uniref:Uncharacterized protein (TIGR02246 family) n=1 Tax=Chitinophaga niastensis TaxID=536980 RepID=A0A2P8HFJ4_CHINA|nr:SgcJ/EcaC family oxidoreductase [Chitinophaga niastensis]PSL44986.1 uncharacterized protein (TIGR02246 family) [Chitinophaga niastensis]